MNKQLKCKFLCGAFERLANGVKDPQRGRAFKLADTLLHDLNILPSYIVLNGGFHIDEPDDIFPYKILSLTCDNIRDCKSMANELANADQKVENPLLKKLKLEVQFYSVLG